MRPNGDGTQAGHLWRACRGGINKRHGFTCPPHARLSTTTSRGDARLGCRAADAWLMRRAKIYVATTKGKPSMADQGFFKLTTADGDVAVLTLDDPRGSANVFSKAVLDDLDKHLTALESRKDLAGLVIRSGKPGVFVVGADIREFVENIDMPHAKVVEMCAGGRQLFQRLSKMPFVTVTAIEGQCVGGGAELALWCDRRVMASDAKSMYGFPEVKLGLLPGWGGTVRAPRMLGLSNAVELITAGESIDAKAAAQMGLISDLVPAARLLESAVTVIRAEQKSGQWKKDREAWHRPVDISDTELGFFGATASAVIQQQTGGKYPAPGTALEVMLEASALDADAAGAAESEAMANLFGSPVNRALINVFFLTDRNKKDTGVENARTSSRPGSSPWA